MRQMKWIAPLVALGLVLTWGMAKAVDAAPGGDAAAKGSITGTVTVMKEGVATPVAGATVTYAKAVAFKGENGVVPQAEGQVPPKKAWSKNMVKTDADGKYTFADVVAGDYNVMAKSEAGKAQVKVTVKAGEAATADLVLQKPDPAKPKG